MLNLPKVLVCTVLIAMVVARARSVYDSKVQMDSGIKEHRRRMSTVIGNSFVN